MDPFRDDRVALQMRIEDLERQLDEAHETLEKERVRVADDSPIKEASESAERAVEAVARVDRRNKQLTDELDEARREIGELKSKRDTRGKLEARVVELEKDLGATRDDLNSAKARVVRLSEMEAEVIKSRALIKELTGDDEAPASSPKERKRRKQVRMLRAQNEQLQRQLDELQALKVGAMLLRGFALVLGAVLFTMLLWHCPYNRR